MKIFKIFTASLIALVISTCAFGQTTTKENVKGPKTDTFKVNGECGMCKTRIEKGLKMDGIAKAEWDQKSKMAVVTYDPSKITVDEMKKKVASLGHDTDNYKSPDDVYSKLPDCCHYDRTKL
jgi:periplasmic mercuric ion binding protein